MSKALGHSWWARMSKALGLSSLVQLLVQSSCLRANALGQSLTLTTQPIGYDTALGPIPLHTHCCTHIAAHNPCSTQSMQHTTTSGLRKSSSWKTKFQSLKENKRKQNERPPGRHPFVSCVKLPIFFKEKPEKFNFQGIWTTGPFSDICSAKRWHAHRTAADTSCVARSRCRSVRRKPVDLRAEWAGRDY